MGKPVVRLSSRAGYRIWAATYDRDLNPLIALEQRIAGPLLGPLAGKRVLDLCAGTGRWMAIASSMRAQVTGVDLSPEMLRQAARKNGLGRHIVAGDLACLPIRNRAADLAICSFGLSYVSSVHVAFEEMARVARRVIASDMHPAALRAGWNRSFEIGSRRFCLAHYVRSLDEIERAAAAAGLESEYNLEACFGEPERALFEYLGKGWLFDRVSNIPAVYVKSWVGRC